MSHQDNIRRIEIVFDALQELRNRVVFVGGSTVSLYAKDVEPFDSRVTDDVDGIVEVINYSAHADFEEQLRKHGFADDITSRVRCRYIVKNFAENVVVDIMPTQNISMGFENRWYPDGFKNAIEHLIAPGKIIKILAPPYFLATKLEAFKTRGGDNGLISKDFEDIVYVFENREIIWNEIRSVDRYVQEYLRIEFKKLLNHRDFEYWVDYHVSYSSPPPTSIIIGELERFISEG